MEVNHILIVEDDKEIRDGIEIYLRSQGYEVSKAANGKEGLDVIASKEIHLAIVDVMMPVMDGILMVMELRKTHVFPVIMLSAKSEEVDKILGLNMGADDYVTKPFTPLELLARVNSQLRRYRQFMEVKKIAELSKKTHPDIKIILGDMVENFDEPMDYAEWFIDTNVGYTLGIDHCWDPRVDHNSATQATAVTFGSGINAGVGVDWYFSPITLWEGI